MSDRLLGLEMHFEAQKFELYKRECDRSGLFHCPSCDEPVIEELDSIIPRAALIEGQVPLHCSCSPPCPVRVKPLNEWWHWRTEEEKRKRYEQLLADQARLDTYLDWVEGTIEPVEKGDLAHCPNCDRPFVWDIDGAQVQFEAGLVPGHPSCTCTHQPQSFFDFHTELNQLDRARRAA